MSILFSNEYSGFTKKSQVIYVVKPKQGAVACATEEIYKNVQNFYLKNDLKAIENEIKSKNCIILKNGDELEAYEGICDVADENSVKLFKSKKVFLQKIYVPCFAVEMQKIIEESQEEIDEQIEKSQDTIELNDTKQELLTPEIENKKIEPKNTDKKNVDLPKIN